VGLPSASQPTANGWEVRQSRLNCSRRWPAEWTCPFRQPQGRKQAMSYWEMATPLPLASDGVPGFPA
jgi:hypothetical protein